MYRFITALVIVNLVVLCSGHFGHHHGRHGHGFHGHGHRPGCNHDESEHSRAMREFLEANERLKKFCNDFSKVEPLITYGLNAVDIEYALPSGENNVEVTITDTVLKANVTTKSNGQDTVAFTDVRVLPDILNFNKATWLSSDNKLKITIPYTIKLQEQFTAKCGTVNNTVIVVPNVPALIYRASKDGPEQY